MDDWRDDVMKDAALVSAVIGAGMAIGKALDALSPSNQKPRESYVEPRRRPSYDEDDFDAEDEDFDEDFDDCYEEDIDEDEDF